MTESEQTTSKPKGKAIKLPETEEKDSSLPDKKTVNEARELARRVSPLALGLFEAKTKKDET